MRMGLGARILVAACVAGGLACGGEGASSPRGPADADVLACVRQALNGTVPREGQIQLSFGNFRSGPEPVPPPACHAARRSADQPAAADSSPRVRVSFVADCEYGDGEPVPRNLRGSRQRVTGTAAFMSENGTWECRGVYDYREERTG
jgi:hypothetical protein